MSKTMTDIGNSIAGLKRTCNYLSDAYKTSHVSFILNSSYKNKSKDFCEFWDTVQKSNVLNLPIGNENIPNDKTCCT